MESYGRKSNCIGLVMALGVSLWAVGCATQSSLKSTASYQLSDVEGAWSWHQDPWYGEFVLTVDGDACNGVLDDVYEGTFGDKIEDVTVSENHIEFRRAGQFGIQHWEGTLLEKKGQLEIVDGRWTKGGGISGLFTAEKKD